MVHAAYSRCKYGTGTSWTRGVRARRVGFRVMPLYRVPAALLIQLLMSDFCSFLYSVYMYWYVILSILYTLELK